jgi:glycosyltransferase involved in cell wall biosynthesis
MLSRAKVYVHCFENEPFGISIVESMAAGCVPIVHRSGGAYHDIIDHDKYGFSFETINELCRRVTFLMEKDNEFERDSKKAIHRSMCFNKRSFEEKIINLVESKAASADGK